MRQLVEVSAANQRIARILALARQHGFRPHIAHLSTAGGLAEIEAARSAGLPVTCEVAPHHLFFDRENRGGTSHSGWLQMNPPLRTPEDRRALIEGLRRGAIDIIATDHAPHSIEENERGISGVPLLDTFAPFLGWLAEEEGFDWAVLVERAARRPAEIFRDFLPARYGALEVGCSAGFVVLDPESPWTVRNGDIRSRAGWSPFEGHTFPVSVVGTAVGGEFRMFGVRDREA
ncbi:MAG: dihydroorotase [Planctomycetota bacterium]